jgi:hypothetical protein
MEAEKREGIFRKSGFVSSFRNGPCDFIAEVTIGTK